VFGAEFVVMKNGIDSWRVLSYTFRMSGITLGGPTFVYGDNKYVVHNIQPPESVLKKTSNSICYHAVCESAVMG
jgi:hypothetical protein